MAGFLKWLDKNEYAVHFFVTLTVFYGIFAGFVLVTAPEAISSLTASFVAGISLVLVGGVAYKVASFVTETIKNAAARAAIEQIREAAPPITDIIKDRVVDYTSSNVLVVKTVSDELKDTVADLKAAAESVSAETAPSKKKRGRPAKSDRKEG